MRVVIVILNYNGRSYLSEFLAGVIKHSPGCEVMVADNHSSDDSVHFLEKNFPDVRVIRFESNLGFAAGYNEAFKQVDADYYVLLNSDVEVTEGWLDPLIRVLEQDTSIAACQPKILDFENREYFEYAGAAGGFIDMLGYPFCRGRIFSSLEKDYGQYDDDIQVFWASGACLVLRASAFDEVGGFDGDFFAHMEEIDLCWRLQNLGYKIFYSARASVYHVGGGTLSKSNPLKTYLNFRNSFITLIKNTPRTELWYKIPVRFLLDLAAGLKMVLSGSFRDLAAIIKADLYIILNLKHIFSKRLKPFKRGDELVGVYPKLIALAYFWYNKRYFFNLRSIIPDRIISSP